jgi:hypothetical protein
MATILEPWAATKIYCQCHPKRLSSASLYLLEIWSVVVSFRLDQDVEYQSHPCHPMRRKAQESADGHWTGIQQLRLTACLPVVLDTCLVLDHNRWQVDRRRSGPRA